MRRNRDAPKVLFGEFEAKMTMTMSNGASPFDGHLTSQTIPNAHKLLDFTQQKLDIALLDQVVDIMNTKTGWHFCLLLTYCYSMINITVRNGREGDEAVERVTKFVTSVVKKSVFLALAMSLQWGSVSRPKLENESVIQK